MGIGNYLENKELDHVYGGPAFTRPTTLYFQLHSGDPGEACTSNVIAGVARAALTNNSSGFPGASGGSKTNGLEINWGSTAGLTLADATHVSIWDALTGGNPLDYFALNATVVVSDKVKVSIPPGSLTLTRA